jgi:hypothetical protein
MIISKLETYEIYNKVRRVNHYKATNAVVIEFKNKQDAIDYTKYFNRMRYIHAECDDTSVLIYAKDKDYVVINKVFINKKDDITILEIKKF